MQVLGLSNTSKHIRSQHNVQRAYVKDYILTKTHNVVLDCIAVLKYSLLYYNTTYEIVVSLVGVCSLFLNHSCVCFLDSFHVTHFCKLY